MTAYYIVWNKGRTEGYITNDLDDANTAATGSRNNKLGTSSVAEALYDTYTEDGDNPDYQFVRQEIEL